jgi:hypothetical protein
MTSGTTENRRKKLIQLIHIGKANMGLTDEAYRAFLTGICGKDSAVTMTERQLASVLKAMRNIGFDAAPRRVKNEEQGMANPAQLEYIKGMWQKCARNKSDAALLAFIDRIVHVKSLRFLTVQSAGKVILALRAMMIKAEAKASLGIEPDTSEPKVPPESLDD